MSRERNFPESQIINPTPSRLINTQKRTWSISSHLDLTLGQEPIYLINDILFSSSQPCTLVKVAESLTSEGASEGMENESVSSSSTVRLAVTTKSNEEDECNNSLSRKSFVQEARMYYIHFNSHSLESYSRVAFPLLFAIFNLIYWLTYCGQGDSHHGIC